MNCLHPFSLHSLGVVPKRNFFEEHIKTIIALTNLSLIGSKDLSQIRQRRCWHQAPSRASRGQRWSAGLTVTDKPDVVLISDSRWPTLTFSLLKVGLWFEIWQCLGSPETGHSLACFMKLGLGEGLELSKYCKEDIPQEELIQCIMTLNNSFWIMAQRKATMLLWLSSMTKGERCTFNSCWYSHLFG